MDAFGLPKNSPQEKAARTAAIQEATQIRRGNSAQSDGDRDQVLRTAGGNGEEGNPASISDVGVGALATRACIDGAGMNVRINLGQL